MGPMRVLLDTHALLWWLFDDPQLSNPVREVIKSIDTQVFASSASAWEIATKHRLGKLPEAQEASRNLPALLRAARIDALPITMEHAIVAGSLARPHRGPFDRMLIAQAMIEEMAIITSDSEFAQFDVKIIW